MCSAISDRSFPAIAIVVCLATGMISSDAQVQSAAKAEAAYRKGLMHIAMKETDKAIEAFEEAIRLAPDVKYQVKVYRGLLPFYRTLDDVHPMFTALEFLITHSDRKAERSLKRTELLSFAFQRGKVNLLRERCELRIANVPDDPAALWLLADIYDRHMPNPTRGVEIGERLVEVLAKTQKEPDTRAASQLARQYGKTGEWQKSALLWEKIAPLEKRETAHHLMWAAKAWLKIKEKDKALAAAKKSAASPPEKRSELLTYFWHAGIAEVFMETAEFKLAIEHFEKALEHTNIEGYRKKCEGQIAAARMKLKKKDQQ